MRRDALLLLLRCAPHATALMPTVCLPPLPTNGVAARTVAPMAYEPPRAPLRVIPDATVLVWYYGWAWFFRLAATGVRPVATWGLDLPALTAGLGGGAVLASTWVGAAVLTGVLGDEHRYDRGRVGLTWLLAAPAAQLAKAGLYGGFRWDNAATDVIMTLFLMLALREAEQRGLL